jgi:hypothetical protein
VEPLLLLGYGLVLGTFGGYAFRLRRRRAALERELDDSDD